MSKVFVIFKSSKTEVKVFNCPKERFSPFINMADDNLQQRRSLYLLGLMFSTDINWNGSMATSAYRNVVSVCRFSVVSQLFIRRIFIAPLYVYDSSVYYILAYLVYSFSQISRDTYQILQNILLCYRHILAIKFNQFLTFVTQLPYVFF